MGLGDGTRERVQDLPCLGTAMVPLVKGYLRREDIWLIEQLIPRCKHSWVGFILNPLAER